MPARRNDLPNSDPNRIVRGQELRTMLGDISEMTLWRLRHQPDFPKTVRISKRLVGHRAGDVARYIAEHMDGDDAA